MLASPQNGCVGFLMAEQTQYELPVSMGGVIWYFTGLSRPTMWRVHPLSFSDTAHAARLSSTFLNPQCSMLNAQYNILCSFIQFFTQTHTFLLVLNAHPYSFIHFFIHTHFFHLHLLSNSIWLEFALQIFSGWTLNQCSYVPFDLGPQLYTSIPPLYCVTRL